VRGPTVSKTRVTRADLHPNDPATATMACFYRRQSTQALKSLKSFRSTSSSGPYRLSVTWSARSSSPGG
jgi:hypothetical protein